MRKNRIRITESDLHGIVKESAKRIISEMFDTPKGQRDAGQLWARHCLKYGPDSEEAERVRSYARKQRSQKNPLDAHVGPMADAFSGGYNDYMDAEMLKRLAKIVGESVKRVLRENEENIQNEVENFVNKFSHGHTIEWLSNNYFVDNHGYSGSIFRNEAEAEESILHGEDHQNAIDCVNGAMGDEEWIKYLIGGGVDDNIASRIIRKHNWDKVVEIIVSTDGPEWFLSTYSGYVHRLSDGSLLYY